MTRLIACSLAGLTFACSNPGTDAALKVTIGYSNVADGGVVLNDDALVYTPGGPFTVDVTAVLTGTPSTDAATSPLHGIVQIDTGFVSPGAIMSGTVTLFPRAGGTYRGAIALAWPPGGSIPVHAVVAGISGSTQVPIDLPSLEIDSQPQVQLGAQATIPLCISSNAGSGTVGVHLEHTTFAGATTGDVVAALIPGTCGDPFPATSTQGWTILSHVLLAAVSPGMPFQASALLQNAVATNPPIGVPTVISIPATTLNPVEVHFTSPATNTHVPLGSTVTLQVQVYYDEPNGSAQASGVTVVFSSSPTLPILPVPAITNSTGVATASFGMPDLKMGALVVYAAVGSQMDTITILDLP